MKVGKGTTKRNNKVIRTEMSERHNYVEKEGAELDGEPSGGIPYKLEESEKF